LSLVQQIPLARPRAGGSTKTIDLTGPNLDNEP
ncbi:MAG: hypothetical protein ACI9HK_005154, partial [Pirellulaceae bacterium]